MDELLRAHVAPAPSGVLGCDAGRAAVDGNFEHVGGGAVRGGRVRQLFDAVSKMPRSKQEMILKMLEPFVREHAKEQAAAH